jgi:hypothetical protein
VQKTTCFFRYFFILLACIGLGDSTLVLHWNDEALRAAEDWNANHTKAPLIQFIVSNKGVNPTDISNFEPLLTYRSGFVLLVL